VDFVFPQLVAANDARQNIRIVAYQSLSRLQRRRVIKEKAAVIVGHEAAGGNDLSLGY